MSTPAPINDDDDLVAGCLRFLSEFDEIRAVLGVYDDTDTPFLFQHRLWRKIEGTQSTAAVVSYAGSWSGSNVHNTMRFPRLALDIYADPIRDELGNVAGTAFGEVVRRLLAAWQQFDAKLHRTYDGAQMWGTVRTLGCVRLADPALDYLPEGDGVRRLNCFYGVTQA